MNALSVILFWLAIVMLFALTYAEIRLTGVFKLSVYEVIVLMLAAIFVRLIALQ